MAPPRSVTSRHTGCYSRRADHVVLRPRPAAAVAESGLVPALQAARVAFCIPDRPASSSLASMVLGQELSVLWVLRLAPRKCYELPLVVPGAVPAAQR